MQSNREAFLDILMGASFGFVVVGVFILIALTLGKPNDTPQEKFKVVDSYGSCDVVRYTDSSNRYNYFLHCK